MKAALSHVHQIAGLEANREDRLTLFRVSSSNGGVCCGTQRQILFPYGFLQHQDDGRGSSTNLKLIPAFLTCYSSLSWSQEFYKDTEQWILYHPPIVMTYTALYPNLKHQLFSF